MPMEFKSRGKYKGVIMDSHDEVYRKGENLTTPEIVSLWNEYEHQFKNPTSLIHKIEAWIHFLAFTELVKDKMAWNYQTRRPVVEPQHSGKGNPAKEQSKKSDPDAYMRPDYYTNPNYGWCD